MTKYERAVAELTAGIETEAAGSTSAGGEFVYATPADGLVVADLRRRLVAAEDDLRVQADLYAVKLAEANARARAYFDLLVAFEAAREDRLGK